MVHSRKPVGVEDVEDGISVEDCQLMDCTVKSETIASSTFGPRKRFLVVCAAMVMLFLLFSLSMSSSQETVSAPVRPHVPHCRSAAGFNPLRSTICPGTDPMMNEFAVVDGGGGEKTIILAGCNNGIDAALLFSQYDASLNIRDWRAALRDLHPIDNGCGQLASSSELTRPPTLPPKVHVHCIEAMPSNVELLRATAAKVDVSSAFRIYPYAVGDVANSTISFPKGRAGAGNIGIAQNAGSNTVEVTYTSIDAMFGHLPSVDMLLIDTEGNDPLVLRGSANTLRNVRYLEFENHIVGAWKTHSLQESIAFLDDLQFDCFWTGNDGTLTRITGCWERAFDVKGWSNIACAKRGDVWWGVMEKMSNSP